MHGIKNGVYRIRPPKTGLSGLEPPTKVHVARTGVRSYHSPLGGYGRCEISGVTYYDSMRALHTISWSLGQADGLTRSKREQTAVRNG